MENCRARRKRLLRRALLLLLRRVISTPGGKRQAEASALALVAVVDADAATQQLGPAVRQGQAQANPASGFMAVTAAERPENAAPLRWRHTGPAILHLPDQATAFLAGPEPDPRIGRPLAVLAGVVDQRPQG